MDTATLRRFAQQARQTLHEQVEAKLSFVLQDGSSARRENPGAVASLKKRLEELGREQLVERVAYIWFNRFCALRYMDVNGYTRIRAVSPAEGQTQPELLAEAKMGHLDENTIPREAAVEITALLNGTAPSPDPQGEAYRKLFVATCNSWHVTMPFLFQKIDDYTELLLPDDLLSANSVLAATRQALTPETCRDVEVIGWLYQYYISEKKDEVFEGLRKNRKVTPENIPAATQLFTPHWIVRYLIQNSLGRLWLLNRPSSNLLEQMEYYIPPEEPDTEFLKIESPEEIRVCDPACGSGHMLTYAFDLLYSIYEEEGYNPSEIPEKILTHNLFGIEIDERAGELAAFALTMKARARQRRFFSRNVRPNVCVLEKLSFTAAELDAYASEVGPGILTEEVQETLKQFEAADNFGSLIVPKLKRPAEVLDKLQEKDLSSNMFLADTHTRVLKALTMAEYLSQKYAVVVANPPYMGSKGMNADLSTWARKNWPKSRSDLFAMFIERGFELTPNFGYSAMVTMQSWMFLSSYETLRERILSESAVECLVHMGNMVMGIAFGTAATVLKKAGDPNRRGAFCYVEYGDLTEENKPASFPPINERNKLAASRAKQHVPSATPADDVSRTAAEYSAAER